MYACTKKKPITHLDYDDSDLVDNGSSDFDDDSDSDFDDDTPLLRSIPYECGVDTVHPSQ